MSAHRAIFEEIDFRTVGDGVPDLGSPSYITVRRNSMAFEGERSRYVGVGLAIVCFWEGEERFEYGVCFRLEGSVVQGGR